MILGIDTSSGTSGVAVTQGDRPLSEISWIGRGNHSSRIMPAINQALDLAGASPRDMSAIAVAIGPGSFNGIRVGLSVAKGMAMGLAIPLVGVSTLDCIGLQASQEGIRIWATMPAGRGEVCIASYATSGGDFVRETAYTRLAVGEAASLCGPGEVAAGESRIELAEAAALRGCVLIVKPSIVDLRRASFLAELGRRYLDAGGSSQLDDLEPLYLRRPAAEEKRAAGAQE